MIVCLGYCFMFWVIKFLFLLRIYVIMIFYNYLKNYVIYLGFVKLNEFFMLCYENKVVNWFGKD